MAMVNVFNENNEAIDQHGYLNGEDKATVFKGLIEE